MKHVSALHNWYLHDRRCSPGPCRLPWTTLLHQPLEMGERSDDATGGQYYPRQTRAETFRVAHTVRRCHGIVCLVASSQNNPLVPATRLHASAIGIPFGQGTRSIKTGTLRRDESRLPVRLTYTSVTSHNSAYTPLHFVPRRIRANVRRNKSYFQLYLRKQFILIL